MRTEFDGVSMNVRYLLVSLILASMEDVMRAPAAELSSTVGKDGTFVVSLTGEIVPGDDESFNNLIRKINAQGRLVSGVRLNSPGGNLLEGLSLAQSIKTAQLATVVARGATCASACFLVFAGGAEKYAHFLAKVGVHGASDEDGSESVSAKAATIGTARIAKGLGVPPGIIGKMVTTPPDQIVWLSPADLRSMGTTMIGKPDQTRGSAIEDQISQLDAPKMQVGLDSNDSMKADPKQIATFLQNEGYSAKISSDKEGDPMISSASQGAKWEVYFYGCTQHLDCQAVQFSAGFSMEGKGTFAQANGWNLKYRFTSAVLDPSGDLVIRMDIQMGQGIPRKLFTDYAGSWDSQLGSFLTYIGFK